MIDVSVLYPNVHRKISSIVTLNSRMAVRIDGKKKDVLEIMHPYLGHDKPNGVKAIDEQGVKGKLFTVRLPIENKISRELVIDPYFEVFIPKSDNYATVTFNEVTLNAVKWLPTGIPDIGTVTCKRSLVYFPPLHESIDRVPSEYHSILNFMAGRVNEDRVLIDNKLDHLTIDVLELIESFKSVKHSDHKTNHEVTFHGQRGNWYEVHFASEPVKVSADHETSHDGHHHWRSQMARAHPWSNWVFVPKTTEYTPVEVTPSRTTVHIHTEDHEEIVRVIDNAKYLFYPPYRTGQVVSDDLRKWTDHKIKDSARTVRVGKRETYPKEDTVNGVFGYWHVIQLPPVFIKILAGKGTIEGVTREWPAQEVVGHFKDVEKFVPLTEIYKEIKVTPPSEVTVHVKLEMSSQLESRVWKTSVATSGDISFLYFPIPVGHQIIPAALEQLVEMAEEGKSIWKADNSLAVKNVIQELAFPEDAPTNLL